MSGRDRYGLTAARDHTQEKAPKPDIATVDIHSHLHIQEAHEIAAPHQDMSQQSFVRFSNELSKAEQTKQEADRRPHLDNVEQRLQDMDAMGLDLQLVMPVPLQSYYWVPADVAKEANRAVNEGIAAAIKPHADRLVALGTAPFLLRKPSTSSGSKRQHKTEPGKRSPPHLIRYWVISPKSS